MLPAHRTVVLSNAALGFLLNLPLNAALAWVTFPPLPTMPLWARGPCVGFDTIGTSLCLPLLTCLVLTPLLRRAVRGGLPGLGRGDLPTLLRMLPHNAFGRGLLSGLACALVFAPLALGLVGALGAQALSREQMAVFKAIYSGVLGLVVTPALALRALADVPHPARSES